MFRRRTPTTVKSRITRANFLCIVGMLIYNGFLPLSTKSDLFAFDVDNWRATRSVALALNNSKELEIACQNLDPCISIHVFAYNRKEATKRLLQRLAESNYSRHDYPLPLVVHLDRPNTVDKSSQEWVENGSVEEVVVDFPWPHGPKILDLKAAHVGLKASWLNAWPVAGPNDIMIAFEDDVVPSPHYFQWVSNLLRGYNLTKLETRDPLLLGISLSPLLVDEVSETPRNWVGHIAVPPEEYPIYLHGLPSSWGVVYFGNQWQDFLSFVSLRSKAPYYLDNEDHVQIWGAKQGDPNLWLPGSKTNSWIRSWKRFMVDFAYGRGAYMIYPNIGSSLGLATSTFLAGEHFQNDGGKNPREAVLVNANDLRLHKDGTFPRYDALPSFDIFCQPIDQISSARRGDQFTRRIASLSPSYAKLAEAWRRPCLLDLSQGYQPHPAQQERSRFLFLVPNKADLSSQLWSIVQGAKIAELLNRKLILPQLFGVDGDWTLVATMAENWVPFARIFDAESSRALLPGSFDFAYSEVENLRAWAPSRIAAFDENLSRLSKAYLSVLGWKEIPRVSLEESRPGSLDKLEKLYTSFGTCGDEMIVLTDVPDDFWGPTSREEIQSIYTRIFKLSKITDHITGTFKSRLGANYHCIYHPPSSDTPFDDFLSLNITGSSPVTSNLLVSGGHGGVATLALDLNKKIFTRTDIEQHVKEKLRSLQHLASVGIESLLPVVIEHHLCGKAEHILVDDVDGFIKHVGYHLNEETLAKIIDVTYGNHKGKSR